MSDLRSLHDDIAAAVPGPGTLAAFDLDGTLISGYSASVVYRDRLRRFDISVAELLRTTGAAVETRFRGADVGNLMRIGVQSLAGRMEDEMQEWGQRLFRQEIARMIFSEVRGLLAAHRHAGHRVVMATSATPYQALSVAADLDIDAEDVLCTRPAVLDGMLTGKLESPPLWGPAKAEALREYAEKYGADLGDSFAYSNGAEDVPMLKSVGHPVALNPDRKLAATARQNGWPSVNLRPPESGADPMSIARTTTAIGALMGAAAFGVSAGLLTQNRQTGANLVGSFGPDLALAICGINVRIKGKENAWSARPAVFMFNHQSSLDMLVIGSVIRRDVTGVAKKEAARDPRFIPVGALLDVAYIDRADSTKARAALRPAVEKLQSGISIAIAPEGTRSPTPRLGKFKKGGFHLAMQAGVPIVPIVIHNAGERMWRNSLVAHPGTVDVDVLAPVPTDGWDLADLDRHVDEVRTLFEDCLHAGHR
ncbi:putative phosphoserine phosphatase/1-acylglycerol-3-phosphate O-acyltransferase [Rhodococcus wratislaviensis]|uniref:Phosphoserine phosphatase (PSP)/ 1-acylglycerol-3-phosphate O-acyltransferase (PlsC) n=2 Tax=Rhodococcus TaxID=1827 RepID=A0AB38FGT2_RHOWR|nr:MULTISPECIES: HAD-IB family hydrolase [Rhodococcus]AII05412.1 phosphoserine phosphatase [Rhodococcus opacus]REE72792.1 putative phosphoserine phosphatase/1-acylglycerol-3-phosphate O-acyltransferase [Rhodococcus wratislaviensis]SPZ40772.1 phosphoserine phosphatase (PSP)/ 1-acylglycerol-3-phosphate O-acyltransferase (PlsC) [Rhodococcus wratislaviensis]